MRRIAARSRAIGDDVIADSFDYIASDEASHLRRVRRWLRTAHPLGDDLKAIEDHTKNVAGRELERAGVMNEAYFSGLTSAEIFRLLGE